MPEEIKEEQNAQAAVDETKRVLGSMADRILDTQHKIGVWSPAEVASETDDMPLFLLDIHAKISMAHQAFAAGGIMPDEEDEVEFTDILIDAAMDLLGAARRAGADVGEAFVNKVIEQARQAVEPLPADLDVLIEDSSK